MEENRDDEVHHTTPTCLLGDKWWPENQDGKEDCEIPIPFDEDIIHNPKIRLTEDEAIYELIGDRYEWLMDRGHTCITGSGPGCRWCGQDVCIHEPNKEEKKMELMMREFERLEVDQFFIASGIEHDMTNSTIDFIKETQP